MMETLYHVAISEKADVVRCGLKFYSANSFKERHDVITKQVFRGRNQVDDFCLILLDQSQNVSVMLNIWFRLVVVFILASS